MRPRHRGGRGELGTDRKRLARKIVDAGAVLTTLYVAMGDSVVIGADDLDKVRSVVG